MMFNNQPYVSTQKEFHYIKLQLISLFCHA